jgi:molecular chaperone GrpE
MQPFDALGEPFDPRRHEAVLVETSSEERAEGEVTRVLARGYQLEGEVLRPAQVAVARAATM